MVLTARLRPDGALVIIAPGGKGEWAFPKVGLERWSGPISPRAHGSLRREGDHLVFRREPSTAGKQPLAGAKGIIIDRRITPVEERLTRIAAEPDSGAAK
jgi:hypothetical protein